ncbi:UDP-N-acetylenolpyruvoylglucosamine reductase [Paraburkholderia domus]|jgi:UDP-N-acetylmuramate dehydrogenase|uniref:UDP-N-acetylenolpyruvoylglucosamine reductase n=1 Tax=Paraburkholderia domus TaxID=2793075 RepID=A0A9N8QW07_9BURK|nr:UDP-N-acetylmuramate dehydrogenase [Paraburkholderia domus]MBK5047411.1 UDP-N-acetylmuramate dehydrogenase [Burkholderia sp. R-70006]MBK5059270.1 UDP-N-acetylmuramate dehydrogenase [Burkholderia sp. R-70199]MBK5086283.1 UDP-N-acetylmuramate dehydrogenase [Burkholderia sp. R-69927]MBK5119364.1 UDP-N-acetylmuramate dehydrogenase [Burkholderia sp. R-69980]MBK5163352.1 UDP-N-acetylmuramate dehydrogenase [Burkholderia sp. R-70211]MBK5179154.1 UDP-N-acetylmuramate dehydrogenase [Burkholderia sp.
MSQTESAAFIAGYPLKAHNTFGFDVRAQFACRIEREAQLMAAVRDPRTAGLPRLVLGGGSNVVLTGDFAGLVLLVALQGRRIVREDDDAWYVEAAAGEPWHDFVAWTLAQGLPGLENLALIPGTVGAAPIQNIGAYGLEMCERFASLRAVELETGAVVELDANACRFGYRDSFFKREGRDRFVITSVTFRLPKTWQPRAGYADLARELAASGHTDAQPDAQAIFDAVVAVRRAKLPDPLQLGNAGSFFKNPVVEATQFEALKVQEPEVVAYPQPDGRVKLAAGWLIDRCGWKGRAMGAAGVHERQALVLVNRGGASGAEVLALARAVQRDVLTRFGVELEAEPVCL